MSSNSKPSAPAFGSLFVSAAGNNSSGFGLAIENSPDATLILQVGSAIIAYANPAAATLFGLPREEITGATPVALQERGGNSKLLESVQELARAGGHPALPEIPYEAGGAEHWVEPYGYAFATSEGAFVLCTLRDVTARRTEARRAETRRRFEALQRLAGGLSHDINNMLTCVRGYSSIVLETPELPEEVREMITLIDNAGIRATAFSRRFLEFSRPDNFDPKPTNLAAFLKNALGPLEQITAPDVRLRMKPVDERLFAMVDEPMLTKALAAVVQNARDASPASGEIELTVRASTRRSLGEPGRPATSSVPTIEIAIADSGRGMSPLLLEQLFEPGFTTKKSAGAPGMGLPNAYRIAREHGGEVEVASREGSGTTVVFVLPRLVKASA